MDKKNERYKMQNRKYLMDGVNSVVKEASIAKEENVNNTKDMIQARKRTYLKL